MKAESTERKVMAPAAVLASTVLALAICVSAPGCGKQPPPPPGAEKKTEAPDVELPGETESPAEAEKELSHGTAGGKQGAEDMPESGDEIKDPGAPRDIDDIPSAKGK